MLVIVILKNFYRSVCAQYAAFKNELFHLGTEQNIRMQFGFWYLSFVYWAKHTKGIEQGPIPSGNPSNPSPVMQSASNNCLCSSNVTLDV